MYSYFDAQMFRYVQREIDMNAAQASLKHEVRAQRAERPARRPRTRWLRGFPVAFARVAEPAARQR